MLSFKSLKQTWVVIITTTNQVPTVATKAYVAEYAWERIALYI